MQKRKKETKKALKERRKKKRKERNKKRNENEKIIKKKFVCFTKSLLSLPVSGHINLTHMVAVKQEIS